MIKKSNRKTNINIKKVADSVEDFKTQKEAQERIKKIKTLIKEIGAHLHEREEIVAVCLLAALTGQNTFLLGPPGTAKSLISRRLACIFGEDSDADDEKNYFEYLMHRFSTPEEIFGPVSIKGLKEDNFTRKTAGFLPQARFAFLDEIWKSSPAILNTLLTLINEKIFRNGAKTEQAPLKSVIVASNETPPENQGLDALYDRFVVRLFVEPMGHRENFEALLQSKQKITGNTKVTEKITDETLKKWNEQIRAIKLSKETLAVIQEVRVTFKKAQEKKAKEKKHDEITHKTNPLAVYVSDRRWKQIAVFLKGAAFFCGRQETNLSDALLLRHCLWTNQDHKDAIIKTVEQAVKNNGYALEEKLVDFDKEKESLEKEINEELYYSKDIYKTKTIEKKEYFYFSKSLRDHDYYTRRQTYDFYIDEKYFKTKRKFNPKNKDGTAIKELICNFNRTGTCSVFHKNAGENTAEKCTPEISFHKGYKKPNVNPRLIKSLKKAIEEWILNIEIMIEDITEHLKKFKKELDTPFVPEKTRDIALQAVTMLLQELQTRRLDCDRLKGLIEKY